MILSTTMGKLEITTFSSSKCLSGNQAVVGIPKHFFQQRSPQNPSKEGINNGIRFQ